MQTEIRQLLDRHCTSLARELAELEPAVARLAGAPQQAPGSDLAACIAQVHRIKGSSGSIGFMEISAAARDLETTLRRARSQAILSGPVRQGIREHVGVLSDLITNVRPEDSRFFAYDFSAFEQGMGGEQG